MPHITISMYPGRTDEVKQQMAKNAKESFVELNSVPEGSVSVSIEEIEPSDFSDEIKKRLNEKNTLVETSDYVK